MGTKFLKKWNYRQNSTNERARKFPTNFWRKLATHYALSLENAAISGAHIFWFLYHLTVSLSNKLNKKRAGQIRLTTGNGYSTWWMGTRRCPTPGPGLWRCSPPGRLLHVHTNASAPYLTNNGSSPPHTVSTPATSPMPM